MQITQRNLTSLICSIPGKFTVNWNCKTAQKKVRFRECFTGDFRFLNFNLFYTPVGATIEFN